MNREKHIDPYKGQRRSWGNVNPVSREFKSDKDYPGKEKHKFDLKDLNWDDDLEEGVEDIKDINSVEFSSLHHGEIVRIPTKGMEQIPVVDEVFRVGPLMGKCIESDPNYVVMVVDHNTFDSNNDRFDEDLSDDDEIDAAFMKHPHEILCGSGVANMYTMSSNVDYFWATPEEVREFKQEAIDANKRASEYNNSLGSRADIDDLDTDEYFFFTIDRKDATVDMIRKAEEMELDMSYEDDPPFTEGYDEDHAVKNLNSPAVEELIRVLPSSELYFKDGQVAKDWSDYYGIRGSWYVEDPYDAFKKAGYKHINNGSSDPTYGLLTDGKWLVSIIADSHNTIMIYPYEIYVKEYGEPEFYEESLSHKFEVGDDVTLVDSQDLKDYLGDEYYEEEFSSYIGSDGTYFQNETVSGIEFSDGRKIPIPDEFLQLSEDESSLNEEVLPHKFHDNKQDKDIDIEDYFNEYKEVMNKIKNDPKFFAIRGLADEECKTLDDYIKFKLEYDKDLVPIEKQLAEARYSDDEYSDFDDQCVHEGDETIEDGVSYYFMEPVSDKVYLDFDCWQVWAMNSENGDEVYAVVDPDTSFVDYIADSEDEAKEFLQSKVDDWEQDLDEGLIKESLLTERKADNDDDLVQVKDPKGVVVFQGLFEDNPYADLKWKYDKKSDCERTADGYVMTCFTE